MTDKTFLIRTKAIRTQAVQAVLAITEKPLMEVIVRRHKTRRSLPQNDIWHAMLNDLANFTGQDAYEIKGYVKGLMGIKHTADMDKMPFSDLIERTYALGAELEYTWPHEPTEKKTDSQ